MPRLWTRHDNTTTLAPRPGTIPLAPPITSGLWWVRPPSVCFFRFVSFSFLLFIADHFLPQGFSHRDATTPLSLVIRSGGWSPFFFYQCSHCCQQRSTQLQLCSKLVPQAALACPCTTLAILKSMRGVQPSFTFLWWCLYSLILRFWEGVSILISNDRRRAENSMLDSSGSGLFWFSFSSFIFLVCGPIMIIVLSQMLMHQQVENKLFWVHPYFFTCNYAFFCNKLPQGLG